MNLTPQQISNYLQQAGYHSPKATKKKALWKTTEGQPFYVNLTADSGTSTIVIAPVWMARVAELQSIPGIVPGSSYYHSSNMGEFPKRKHRGANLISYGLPINVESESGLKALLELLSSEPVATAGNEGPSRGKADNESTQDHYGLLAWFEQYVGQVLTWEQLQSVPSTVTISAKGIYKPKFLPYALSIRQTLDSPYIDQEPEYQEDGSWRYKYAQEEDKEGDSTKLFTNQGLKRCMEDGIPVAVLRQLSKKPDVTRYRVLGLANVMEWTNGIFILQSTTLPGIDAGQVAPQSIMHAEHQNEYDPSVVEDKRNKALREITTRQGQPAFRSGLLTAYEGRCAITGCTITQVLEAAHITPYLGPDTNHISNGLLLRSDLHTLWDKGLIYLNDDFTLQLMPSLAGSEYAMYNGQRITLPASHSLQPAITAIQSHRSWCQRLVCISRSRTQD